MSSDILTGNASPVVATLGYQNKVAKRRDDPYRKLSFCLQCVCARELKRVLNIFLVIPANLHFCQELP